MCISRAAAIAHIAEKQGLHRRLPDPTEAMRSLIAVQTQYPASLSPALAARADRASAKEIERLLKKERAFLKAWNLRRTVHTAMAEDHLLLIAALRTPLVEEFRFWMGRHGVDLSQLDVLHKQVLEALSRKPMGRRELHDQVPFYKNMPMVGWGLDVMCLAFEGHVVFSNQAAANSEFALLSHWRPDLKLSALAEREALQIVIKRYFEAYGPATYTDFLYWTGLRSNQAKPAFSAVVDELQQVEIEGKKGVHYMASSPLSPLLSPVVPQSPLRLLPKFDPLVMAHKDKTLFLPEARKPLVFRKAGQVEAVIFADHAIQGTWRTVRKGKRLEFRIEPFGKLKKAWLKALPGEAHRVARSLGFEEAVMSDNFGQSRTESG